MEEKVNSPKTKYIEVRADEAGVRLDNFLAKHLKKLPKTRLYRAIRQGEVRVNKGRAKPATRLMPGDVVRIPPLQVATPFEPKAVSGSLQTRLNNAILYEDEHLFVINKPAGIPVHGGSGVNIGVIEAMRLMYPQYKGLDLVHRLDKATSGCLMIAKNRKALVVLHQALIDGTITKTYAVEVEGHWPKSVQKVSLPLRKQVLQSGERMVKVDEVNGKPSVTLFKPVEYLADSTKLQATLVTGRTHQIRVHCQATGHPIIGDEKYGKKSKRPMALHAQSLKIKCEALGLDFIVEA